jgi:hypothetical protein
MNVYCKLLLLALIFVSVGGCSTLKGENYISGVDIPIEKMNNEILLLDDPGLGNSYRNEDTLSLIVINNN